MNRNTKGKEIWQRTNYKGGENDSVRWDIIALSKQVK